MGARLNVAHTEGIRSSEFNIPPAPLCPKAQVTVLPVVPDPLRRVMFAELPFGRVDGFAPIHLDTKDQKTQVDGLQHRMARLTPQSNKQTMQRFASFVKWWCRTYLEPLTTEPSFDEWLAGCDYPLERKAELASVFDDLHGAPPNRKQRRKIASFIKSESYYEFKHARWINSRSDAFKAWSGPWFKAIEERVFALPWFIKHTPVPERPSKVAGLLRPGARYYATDHTAFEAHMGPEFMAACELTVYRYMLQRFPDVADLICKTIGGVNHGATRRGVQFRVKGRRMSGDMCTSLGNGLTNLLLWAFFCREKKCEWDGFVEGDDGIFATVGSAPTRADYLDLGFDLKIEEGNDPRVMSFCGIVAADGQNVRDPAKLLTHFGWTSSCIGAGLAVRKSLLRAKALSLLYENPHCPILRAIADRALVLTRGSVPRFVRDGWHSALPEFKAPDFAPTAATREMFAALYNISPAEQEELELQISAADDLNFLAGYFAPSRDTARFERFFVASAG